MSEVIKIVSIVLSIITVFISLSLSLFKSYGTQLENKLMLDIRLKIDFSTVAAIYFLYLFGAFIGVVIWGLYISDPNIITDKGTDSEPLQLSIIFIIFFCLIILFAFLMVLYRNKFDSHINKKSVIYKDKEYFSSIIPIVLGMTGLYCSCEVITKRSLIEGILILLLSTIIALLTTNAYLNYHKLVHSKECYLYFNESTHRIRCKILMVTNGFILVEQEDIRAYLPVSDVKRVVVVD